MTIFFVLNYLVDLLPFQYQGEVVASLLTRPTTKRRHWLLTLWTSDQWPSAVAEPIIKALETTTTFIYFTVKYLGTDRSILSHDLESATCFHDYIYQLQSSTLDMSVVTWASTIISWSEFLLLDAVDFFPQLKRSNGSTLINILPMSAELVNRYLSEKSDNLQTSTKDTKLQKGVGTKTRTLFHHQSVKKTENLPEQMTIVNDKGKLSTKKIAQRGIENIRRKRAIDEMVRANKCFSAHKGRETSNLYQTVS